MEFVEPIRDKKKVEALCHYLKGKCQRDYVLFLLGINSCLRISDLLRLQVVDVKERERIVIREKKTNKSKNFPLNPICLKALKGYIKDMPDDAPLFPSRKGGAAISRQHAYTIINTAARAVGLKAKIGTHTMRKTFAYWAYRQTGDLAMVQKLLNHASPDITLRYIGITQDDMDKVYTSIQLGV